MSDPRPEFSFPVDVTSLPQSGRQYRISADAGERMRVAARLGLVDIAALTAEFELTPRAGGTIAVTGHVDSELTQSCVVTLVPVGATIHEAVEARFMLAAPEPAKKSRRNEGQDADEELVELGEDEPPEPAVDGLVDLGELAVVHLALALDPYPRAAGAAFEGGPWAKNDEKSVADSPFAVLAELKKKPPSKGVTGSYVLAPSGLFRYLGPLSGTPMNLGQA